MTRYWLLLSLLLYVKYSELRNTDKVFTCDFNSKAELTNSRNPVLNLILRDVNVGSPFRTMRNLPKLNGITSCKSVLGTLGNLTEKQTNPVLEFVLKYYQVDFLTLPSPLREHFWKAINIRRYDRAQIFLKDFQKPSEISESKKFIKGKTLLAAARDQKPSITFTVVNNSKNVRDVSGDNFELIEIIQKSLGFNYTIIPSFESSTFINGSFRGTIGMLSRKEADINLQPFTFDANRNPVVDFSLYTSSVPFTVMIPYPKEIRSLLASTWPFKHHVWLWLVVTMVVTTLILTMAAVMRSRNTSLSQAASQSFMFTYGIITCQGLECPGRAHKSRLVAGIWGMACLLFVYSYNSQLTSYLTVPQLNPLVNSIDELARTDELDVIIMAGNSIVNEFLMATSGPYKIIGDRIRKNVKDRLSQTYEEAIDKVASGSHAFVVNLYTGVHYGNLLFQKTRTCSLMAVKYPMNNVYSTLTLQKGSPYLPAINEKIQRITEGGIMIYIMKYSSSGLPRFQEYCKAPIKDFPTNVILTLSQLQSAFAVLGIGLLASLLAIISEIIHAKLSS